MSTLHVTAHTAAAHTLSMAAIAGVFWYHLPDLALIPPAVFYSILSIEKMIEWRDRNRDKRRQHEEINAKRARKNRKARRDYDAHSR